MTSSSVDHQPIAFIPLSSNLDLFARANTLLLEVKYALEKINNSIVQEQVYESKHKRKYCIQKNTSENLSAEKIYWSDTSFYASQSGTKDMMMRVL